MLVARRRFEEASRHIDAALAIDHSSRFLRSHRIQILLFSGQFEQAAWESEDILNDQPEFTMGLINYGAALLGLERPAEALGRFERAFAGSSHPIVLDWGGSLTPPARDSLDAAATVARVQQLYDAGGCSRCVVGLAHAAIGELETAIDAHGEGITERDIRLPIYTQRSRLICCAPIRASCGYSIDLRLRLSRQSFPRSAAGANLHSVWAPFARLDLRKYLPRPQVLMNLAICHCSDLTGGLH